MGALMPSFERLPGFAVLYQTRCSSLPHFAVSCVASSVFGAVARGRRHGPGRNIHLCCRRRRSHRRHCNSLSPLRHSSNIPCRFFRQLSSLVCLPYFCTCFYCFFVVAANTAGFSFRFVLGLTFTPQVLVALVAVAWFALVSVALASATAASYCILRQRSMLSCFVPFARFKRRAMSNVWTLRTCRCVRFRAVLRFCALMSAGHCISALVANVMSFPAALVLRSARIGGLCGQFVRSRWFQLFFLASLLRGFVFPRLCLPRVFVFPRFVFLRICLPAALSSRGWLCLPAALSSRGFVFPRLCRPAALSSRGLVFSRLCPLAALSSRGFVFPRLCLIATLWPRGLAASRPRVAAPPVFLSVLRLRGPRCRSFAVPRPRGFATPPLGSQCIVASAL